MLGVISALIPVFLIILLGYGLRRIGFPEADENVWRPIERLTYFVLFPCLIFFTLITARLGELEVLPMGSALLAAMGVVIAGLVVLRPRLGLTGPEYSSVFQGAVRWNGFVGIAAAASLYGEPGTTLAAIAIAFMVPTVNVISVLVLTRHAGPEPPNLTTTLKLLARNPLIIAVVLGVSINASGIALYEPIERTVDVLGRAALTLGLLAVGAGFDVEAARRSITAVSITTGVKLVAMPALVAGFCVLFGVEGITQTVAVLCASVPGATSSYVLARQLGGDATLMAGLITASTIAAMITMPIIVSIAV